MDFLKYRKKRWLAHLLTVPFIYVPLIVLVILDFFLELYQQAGFRLGKIPIVQRKSYIRIDRQKLEYLTAIQKINCM